MNSIEETIIRAVAAGRVTKGTVMLAKRVLERKDALAAQPNPPAVEHHAKERKAEEREREYVSEAVWQIVLTRTLTDHGLVHACESCDGHFRFTELEPHHLELGAGGRRDAPEVVMALCDGCHRLGPNSAHRRPLWFAQNVVIPWAEAHGYGLPNRKEYR